MLINTYVCPQLKYYHLQIFTHQNAPAGAQQDSVKNQPTPQYAIPIKKSDRNKDIGVRIYDH